MRNSKRTNTATWHDKHKRWQINVQKDGIRRSFYDSTPGRNGQRACNAKADAWLDDNIADENSKISTLFEAYLDDMKQIASQTNINKTTSVGKCWILPCIGNIRISHLNEQHLQNMIDKAYKKGLSKKSLMNIRGITNTFLKYCRKRNATSLYPENVVIPHGAHTVPKNILQPPDLKKLFTSSKTKLYGKEIEDPYINAYRFQVLAGLRPGELMALKWSEINGRIVTLHNSKNFLGEITDGKNKNARRRFYLTDMAAAVLEEQKKIAPNGQYVFGDMTLSRYEKYWRRYREYNQIGNVTLYELRHTFVSISKSVPEGNLKAIIGHSKNMDTYGVYGHEVDGELEKTAISINSLFESILE